MSITYDTCYKCYKKVSLLDFMKKGVDVVCKVVFCIINAALVFIFTSFIVMFIYNFMFSISKG